MLRNDLELLKEFLSHSLSGLALEDDSIQEGVKVFWNVWGSWKAEDGLHHHSSFETWLLLVRGLKALVDDPLPTNEDGTHDGVVETEESRTELRSWMPSPTELLRIAECEGMWRAHPLAVNHPALLFAKLYGERLGDWETAAEVAEGVLGIEQFQPLLRCEAYRLLGKARHALGQRRDAMEAAEGAVAEAVSARYVWMEMLALRDAMDWCEPGGGERYDLRARLEAVVSKMKAPAEDLEEILGSGWKEVEGELDLVEGSREVALSVG